MSYVPGTRIEAALKKVPDDQWMGLADYIFPISRSAAVNKGHEEAAVEKAAGQNVYTFDMTRSPTKIAVRICFFGDSEWEVLDRLGVAEVMLG